MSAASFEKTNIGWQIRQLQQQAQEWWELQFSQLRPNLPDILWPSWGIDWEALSWLSKLSFWLILTGLSIWLGLRLLRRWPFLFDAFPSLAKKSPRSSATESDRPLTAVAWLQRSREFQKQGNYHLACRALYMAMLQRLDEAGILPAQPSRTDGEYRQLLQQQPRSQPYQILIATHEQQLFGEMPATIEDLNRCQEAYREISPP